MKLASFLALVLATAGLQAEAWQLRLPATSRLNASSNACVAEGETKVVTADGQPALAFSPAQKPAVFKTDNILDNNRGTLSLQFKPAKTKDKAPLHCNYLFQSGHYYGGYNTSPQGDAIYVLGRTDPTKSGSGIYAKVTIPQNTWHTFHVAWTPQELSLTLDGKLIKNVMRQGHNFGKTLRIGSDGWAFTNCLIRNVTITGGPQKPESVPGLTEPDNTLTATAKDYDETYPAPRLLSIAGNHNLIHNSDFSRLVTVTDSVRKKLAAKGFQFKTALMPSNWIVDPQWFQPPQTEGQVSLTSHADDTSQAYITLETPNNKWNQIGLTSLQKIPAEILKEANYHIGFWARGRGTVTVNTIETNNLGTVTKTVRDTILINADWHFYRTAPLASLQPQVKHLQLSFTVYGKMDFAMPELSQLPPIDPAAELSFYVPFDRGSAEARFSLGQVAVAGPGETPDEVPGKVDGAYRIHRQRKITPNGFVRFPMGLTYDGMNQVLNPEEGTIEFWFRPLDEMLHKQAWNPFNLFQLGTTSYLWPFGKDFILHLDNHQGDGNLDLVLTEAVKMKEWPSRKRVPNKPNNKITTYPIPNPKTFVGTWHHLAFTYDNSGRKLWLDGACVLKAPALKTPSLTNTDTMTLGVDHLTTPFLASCDVDELKIYRNVRYHSTFIPEAKALKLIPAGKTQPAFPDQSQFTVGKPTLNPAGDSFLFPIAYGGQTFKLNLAMANGSPLIFSSKNNAMQIRTPHQPVLPLLPPVSPVCGKDTVSARIVKQQTHYSWKVKEQDGLLNVSLTIDKPEGFWTAYLEPRLSLQSDTPWQKNFDGSGTREVLLPFKPFAYESVMKAMPMTAAWNGHRGFILALKPECLTSYLSRGMNTPNTLDLAVRTVLDEGQSVTFQFEIIPFDATYAEDSAVDAYHAKHPETFKRDPKVDQRIYGNIGITSTWDTPAFRQRKNTFSLAEINRRARATWCWYYSSGLATGNWEPDLDMLEEMDWVNAPLVANADFNATFHQRTAYRDLDRIGTNPCPYVSQWTEKRLTRFFSDSVYDDIDITSGIDSVRSYYLADIVDVPMLQTGTKYGIWLRNQIQGIFDHYPQINAFSHDELVGNYKFRKANNLGGLRAFDENGSYLHNMVSMGRFTRDVRNMANQTQFKTAFASNARIQDTSFLALFNSSNNIHERPIHWLAEDWKTLRQHTRLMGERSNTIYPLFPFTGNYFNPKTDDPRLLRYCQAAYKMQQVLLGLLFNLQMNYNILGTKEAVQSLDELNRAHELGYRLASAASTTGQVPTVRYGEPGYGLIGLVNASSTPRRTTLTVDAAYLKKTPILALKGSTISSSHHRTTLPDIKPLSWLLVEMPCSADGATPLTYQSTLDADANGRTLTITFQNDETIRNLQLGLYPHETLTTASLNGTPVRWNLHQRRACLGTLKVNREDTLTLITRDQRWNSPIKDILAYPYLRNRTLELVANTDEATQHAARIAEFFRFWTLNQPDRKAFKPAITDQVSSTGDKPRIVLDNGQPCGISLKDKVVHISGTGQKLTELVELFLAQLDRIYPFYGYFGEQHPVYPLNFTTTPEQKAYNTAAGVIGKTLSTQDAARDFNQWLKETQIDPTKSF